VRLLTSTLRALARPQVGIAVVSTLVVLVVAIVDAGRTSPGPLTRAHARIPELSPDAGRSSCKQCHGGWRTSMTDSCLACHEVIRTHVVLDLGLHGRLPEAEVSDCGRCHADHHGEGFTVVNLQSFREAGIRAIEEFDHALVGWDMNGRHAELACTECHANAEVGELPAGEHRFLGLDRDCASCHEDAHEGRMQLDCAQCHGQTKFTELFALGHERVLPLTGGHAAAGCRECHAEGGESSLERIGARGVDEDDVRECRDCHDDPHAQAFVDGVAAQSGRTPGAGCVVCHEPWHQVFRARDLTVTPRQHAASGFPLDVPHAEVECTECHGAAQLAFDARYLDRDADTCSACHDDPHGGQFREGPFSGDSGGDCLACHERTRFEPHAFGTDDHERAALALDGAHLALECERCHEVRGVNRPRTFRGTPSDCDGCHVDAHASFFAPHAKKLDAAPHGICAACHGTDAFADELAAFDHATHAGFALDGAHGQAACESCHPRAAEPDELGRAFGRVVDGFGAVDGCADCHADPHRGDFDRPGLPRAIDGSQGCARCHTTASFRALRIGWDHRRWTGFELDGAHGEAACSACHAPRATPDAHGRTWEPAVGARCADCHAEPHARQFARDGATSCERCHESAEGWDALDFDHERDARFPLEPSHTGVVCAACHVPADPQAPENLTGAPARLPAGVVRYRPMETGCVACHGTLDGPALKRRGR
jgi:hypothetical protein